MNCEQANRIDLVLFLANVNFHPVRIRGYDHWYVSPLHQDRTPSFKVNQLKNTWFDFGIGKGGTLVDFVCFAEGCDVPSALAKIASTSPLQSLSFQPQRTLPETSEKGLRIINVSDIISDTTLKAYLRQRRINIGVASRYCKQIQYENAGKEFTAIGFKNNSGGYELRAPNFKGSSSPKFVTYFDKAAGNIAVFEGFFDLLAYQSMLQKQPEILDRGLSNILVLNSLSFFTRSLLLMERHKQVHLFLDNDAAGDESTRQILHRAPDKVIDERSLYNGFKDISEWWSEKGLQLRQQKRFRI
jgi:hypothetical protein